MAGNAVDPFRSAWLGANTRFGAPGIALLYGRISFGDTNLNDGTLWDNWFFGATQDSLFDSQFMIMM